MGLFTRRPKQPGDSDGLGALLLQGQDMIQQTSRAHADRWGLGTADRWDLDQQTGIVRWTFPGKVVEAPAQILGTYSPTGHTWMWAWANPSLLPALVTASEEVREWGRATTMPSSPAPASTPPPSRRTTWQPSRSD